MEQAVFLLVVGAIALLRWLYERSQGPQGEPRDSDEPKVPHFPRPRQSSPRAPADTEEERMRRFMEALGIPGEPVKPPPVRRAAEPPTLVKTAPPPIPVPVQRAPERVPESFGVKTIEGSMEEIRRLARQSEEEAQQILASAGVRATAIKVPTPRVAVPQLEGLNIPALLGNPAAVRSAIVLREVLGPPRAFDPLGDVPGLR